MSDQEHTTPRDCISGDRDENVAELLPIVLAFMKSSATGHEDFRHSWPIDPCIGIEDIANYAAMFMPHETDLIMNHTGHLRLDSTPEAMALWGQARGYVRTVHRCVLELIERGLVEIFIESDWPAIRLTLKGLSEPTEPRRDMTGDPVVATMARIDAERTAESAAAMLSRIDELRVMPYTEYLQSAEWRHRREQHIEAAGNRCQLCNSNKQPLHVHHRTYANRGRENFYDLVALCGVCHQNFHQSGRKVR